MIEHSEGIKNISAALLEFHAETHGVVRDSTNPHFRNRYASLEAVIDTAKPGLQKAGLIFVQAPGRFANGCLSLTTMLMHTKSGEWFRSTLEMPLAKQDPQGIGSATTYGCRYALMAILGLPPVDDDAEATQGSVKPYATQTAGVLNQELISKADREKLAKLVDDAKADLGKFLMVMNVETLADIPASQFERAKAALDQKIAVNKKVEEQLEAAKTKKQVSDNGRTGRHV